MEAVAGIYNSAERARQAVQQIQSLGINKKRIVLLTPGMNEKRVEGVVPVMDTEQTGEGKAMGGAVGAAMGIAGGASLGAAAASLFVPGVGAVIAGGLLGAAILGAGGTITGMAAGEALDEELAAGLPHDDLFVYEDALRKGRSVVIALTEDSDSADRVRELLAQSGAVDIDTARDSWWIEVRPAEEAHCRTVGSDFRSNEVSYRRGFEAALNVGMRGKSLAEAKVEFDKAFADAGGDEALRQGFERGLAYQKDLEKKHKP
jgi:hypothetical protein